MPGCVWGREEECVCARVGMNVLEWGGRSVGFVRVG